MKLKTGTVVLFRYNKYREDKNPLALILHDSDKHGNVHALNLNYLPQRLTTQVVNLIMKIIEREIRTDDMRRFYHDYLRGQLNPVVSRSYRTYKKSEIKSARVVSHGFANARGVLSKIFKIDVDKIKREKTIIKNQIKGGKIASDLIEKVSPAEAERKAKEYVDIIRSFRPESSDEIDFKTLTTKKSKKDIHLKRRE